MSTAGEARWWSDGSARRIGLYAILALAAVLRLTGLGWGLKHPPNVDERAFMTSVGAMLSAHDLDHRFYEYPGLMMYLLAPALVFFPRPFGPEAYLAARVVVALFGVLSVSLVHRLGAELAGERAGLFAAAILAVSPIEVRTAHMLRPDVVLETFTLLAMIVLLQREKSWRTQALGGSALGAAAAVKFSGVLLVPSYLVQSLVSPPPRARGMLLAAGAALGTFAVLSPYTLLHWRSALVGAREQIAWHYIPEEAQPSEGFAGTAHIYGLWLLFSYGLPGLTLVLGGMFLWRREWRRWISLACLPAVTILVFATAETHRPRFLVPTLGVLAVFAGKAIDALFVWRRGWGAAALASALAFPAWSSTRYLRWQSASTRDDVAAWILEHRPAGQRVLTTLPVGLDPDRFEVVRTRRLDEATYRQALLMDLILAGRNDDPVVKARLHKLFVLPGSRETGPRIEILEPGPELRPQLEPVPLAGATLAASVNADLLERIRDGNPETAWSTGGPQGPGSWITIELTQPALLGRVELSLGGAPQHFGRSLGLEVLGEGGSWRRIPVLPGRAPVRDQGSGPRGHSQVLVFEPTRARSLRIGPLRRHGAPWEVAEVRIDALR